MDNYVNFSEVYSYPAGYLPTDTLLEAVRTVALKAYREELDEAFGDEEEDEGRDLVYEEGEDIGCLIELIPQGVWIYDADGTGSPSVAIAVIKWLQEYFESDDTFVLSWAFTCSCSKPRAGEFGGGAACLYRGMPTIEIDASTQALTMMEGAIRAADRGESGRGGGEDND